VGIALCAALLLTSVHEADAKARKSRRSKARVKKAALSSSGPLSAISAVAVDVQTGDILYGKNPERIQPIASITKLMSALVFLDAHPDLGRTIQISPESLMLPGRKRFLSGEQVIAYDLLCAALIASDNVAAKALALSTGPEQAFVEKMNLKARALGLLGTHFADPTGLNPDNVSTAMDCARLVSIASRDERISQIMQMQNHVFKSNRRLHRIHTTNRLLKTNLDILGGKTGFIRQSGYCLATFVRGENQREVAAAVLGARSNSKRFADMRTLLDKALGKE
jgi:D-alanyl-D-alanine endopeptidase (penicillin-binding protein 7)